MDYKELYLNLFNKITDIIEMLKEIQIEAEQKILEADDKWFDFVGEGLCALPKINCENAAGGDGTPPLRRKQALLFEEGGYAVFHKVCASEN